VKPARVLPEEDSFCLARKQDIESTEGSGGLSLPVAHMLVFTEQIEGTGLVSGVVSLKVSTGRLNSTIPATSRSSELLNLAWTSAMISSGISLAPGGLLGTLVRFPCPDASLGKRANEKGITVSFGNDQKLKSCHLL
jgi:hypothetical protein